VWLVAVFKVRVSHFSIFVLQGFKALMVERLTGESCPLDATLETVLPGVHTRFVATDANIETVRGEVQTGFQQVNTNIGILADGIDELRETAGESKKAIAATCLQVAFSLLGKELDLSKLGGGAGDDTSPGSKRATQDGSPLPASEEPPPKKRRGVEGVEGVDFSAIYLVPKQKDLQGLWDEWHGLGKFEGKPREGGFESLELEFKAKWRRHLDVQHFSRTKRVVAGIKAYIEREGVAEDIAIATLDSVYKDDASSVANMVVWMQDMGLLKRSVARGKQKAALE
jgi:hypothetical protein